MKREIKFRVWFPAGTDTGDGEIEKGQMCYDLAFEEYEPINDLLRGVDHLMQYTGLKDKNGTEVYDGDILHMKDGTRNPYVVVWAEVFTGWGLRGNIGELVTWLVEYIGELTVIGNIYENPELLQEVKE